MLFNDICEHATTLTCTEYIQLNTKLASWGYKMFKTIKNGLILLKIVTSK